MTLITANHTPLLNYKLLLADLKNNICIYFELSYNVKGSVPDANNRLEILLRNILVTVSLYSRILDLI